MKSSLDALVKNISDNDIKYLSQNFSSDLLELVREKVVYPFVSIWTAFKKFSEVKSLDRCKFFSSLKMNVLVKETIHMLLMFGISLE